MGDVGNRHISLVWLVELVGETFLECLEFGTSTPDVVSVGGNKTPGHMEDVVKPTDHLKSLLIWAIFYWSRVWTFTFTHCASSFNSSTLLDFLLDSLVIVRFSN